MKQQHQWRDAVKADLEQHGFGMTEDNQIVLRNGQTSPITVEKQRGRIRTRNSSGALLWSGGRITDFLQAFWFVKTNR